MQSKDIVILSGKEVQDFILANENADERKLVLRQREFQGVSTGLVANQLSGRRKAKSKLPLWYETTGVVYPPSLHLEQSSSELTARYKVNLLGGLIATRKRGVDLTAGFGIDSFFLSRIFETWDCVEPDAGLLNVAQHNHHLLGAGNIMYHATTAETFIKSFSSRADVVFIDPSRRNNHQKVHRFSDCEPRLIEMLPDIFQATDHVLVKASPLLDLQQGSAELGCVEKIMVVAVDDECKEVLFWCSRTFHDSVGISCLNLSTGDPGGVAEDFHFSFSEEKSSSSLFSNPLTYLYEPHAAILKAGAFKCLGSRFGLFKLHVNTHLYTSDQLLDNFPGRIFKVENLKPEPDQFKSIFIGGKVNVLTRNYPLTPDQLKKKYKLHDGGNQYLIGFSGVKEKFLLQASRIHD